MKLAANRKCDGLAQVASIISVSLLLVASPAAAQVASPPTQSLIRTTSNTVVSDQPFSMCDDPSCPTPHPLQSSQCLPHPGFGPGESPVFPRNTNWSLIYRNKNGDLGLTLPMAEGVWGTGDWFGLRHRLVEHGVNIIGGYANNMLGNVVGGKKRGFSYADQLYLQSDFDLQKLIGWQGGHFVVSVLDRNGTNVSNKYTGNLFNPNQIYGSQSFELYNIYLQQNLLDGWVSVKAGRLSATDDFCNSPIFGLYVSNGIDGQPGGICINGYVNAWPASRWGGLIRVNDKKDNLYGQAGIYQTDGRLYNPNGHGVDFSIRPYDGFVLIGEVGWTPEFQPHPQPTANSKDTVDSCDDNEWHGMPGHYKFGGYYTHWAQIPTFNGSSATGTYGLYWMFDQMVYQAQPGSECGLTLWGTFILSPDQAIAKIPYSFYTGAFYTGLIPGRSEDKTAVQITYGSFSDVYAHSGDPSFAKDSDGVPGTPTYELVLEACYTIQVSKALRVQPDVQYIISPGGTGNIPNALVIGAQVGFSF